jgi:hypothetical protein
MKSLSGCPIQNQKVSDTNANHVNNNGNCDSLHAVNNDNKQPSYRNDICFKFVGLFLSSNGQFSAWILFVVIMSALAMSSILFQ